MKRREGSGSEKEKTTKEKESVEWREWNGME